MKRKLVVSFMAILVLLGMPWMKDPVVAAEQELIVSAAAISLMRFRKSAKSSRSPIPEPRLCPILRLRAPCCSRSKKERR
jgi:hypothetical protein